MLRLSKLADYSVVLLATLAKSPTEQATATELAERTLLPAPTVAKLLKKLSKSGHLSATRGATGGYRLAKDPISISAASIIEAIDGPVRIVSCVGEDTPPCGREKACAVHGRWDAINFAIHKALADVTLAAMVAPTMTAPKHACAGRCED